MKLSYFKNVFNAIDEKFREIRDCNEPFGGCVVLAMGDFRQILPVVPGGRVGVDDFDASIKKQKFGQKLKQLD